jgi:hypothetical protein
MKDFIKSWDELKKISTFEGRIEYLRTYSTVGEPTFGYDRWINQRFYRSEEYKRLRRKIVVKQNGWDLGVEGYPLPEIFILHHMNPITVEDIINGSEFAWDPKYLVCVSPATHRAIHYQESKNRLPLIAQRSPNDTSPWRNNK